MGSPCHKMVSLMGDQRGLLFPGQGSQFVGMGKDIYEKYTAARWVFDRAGVVLGKDIKKLCFEGPEEELMTTVNSQPAIFVASLAVLNVLIEKLKGSPVGQDGNEIFSREDVSFAGGLAMGLSLGEPVALVASGAVSFDDGLKFVQRRGEFMDEASKKEPGKMASVLGLELEKLEEICKGVGCQVANLNCPGQVVISGASSRVELAADLAKSAGAKRTIILKVSGAFHSSLMAPAKEKLKAVLDGMEITEPAIDFISNLDGEITRDPEKIRKNLADQLDNKTLWEKSVRNASERGYKNYLEIGPGTVLKGLLKKIDETLTVTCLQNSEDIENYISVKSC